MPAEISIKKESFTSVKAAKASLVMRKTMQRCCASSAAHFVPHVSSIRGCKLGRPLMMTGFVFQYLFFQYSKMPQPYMQETEFYCSMHGMSAGLVDIVPLQL